MNFIYIYLESLFPGGAFYFFNIYIYIYIYACMHAYLTMYDFL